MSLIAASPETCVCGLTDLPTPSTTEVDDA